MPSKLSSFFRPSSRSASSDHASRPGSSRQVSEEHVGTRTASHDGSASPAPGRPASSSGMTALRRFFLKPRSSTPDIPEVYPATLSVSFESPPLVFHGDSHTSFGALMSGKLYLDVKEVDFTMKWLKLGLYMRTKYTKPFEKSCEDCAQLTKELEQWDLIASESIFSEGHSEEFPFSHLLKGDYPCTVNGILIRRSYFVRAELKKIDDKVIFYERELNVSRSLGEDIEHTSERCFPPTKFKLTINYPPNVHPFGEFRASFQIDNICHYTAPTMQHQYRVKIVTWRVDETETVLSVPCKKHIKDKNGTDREIDGTQRIKTRTLATETIKTGWKTDLTKGPDSTINMEFPFVISSEAKASCSIRTDTDGATAETVEIFHTLVLVIVITPSHAPRANPELAQIVDTPIQTLTSSVRLTITERSGMGLEWSNEVAPNYEDLPPSPPHYRPSIGVTRVSKTGTIATYEGTPLPDYEDLYGDHETENRTENSAAAAAARSAPPQDTVDDDDPAPGQSIEDLLRREPIIQPTSPTSEVLIPSLDYAALS